MFSEVVINELQKVKNTDILDFLLKEQRIELKPYQYRTNMKIYNKSSLINKLYLAIQNNIEVYYILKWLKNSYAKSVLLKFYEFKILHFLVGHEKLKGASLEYYNFLLRFSIDNSCFIN